MARLLRSLCALFLALAPLLATAQGAVSPEDARAIRAVIEAQLDAFAKNDAARAFSLATPGIRGTFGSAEKFIAMVRRSYGVVYRPTSVVFVAPAAFNDSIVQPVRLTDAAGHAWLAIYPMQRQPDGSWRTNGCVLRRLSGEQV